MRDLLWLIRAAMGERIMFTEQMRMLLDLKAEHVADEVFQSAHDALSDALPGESRLVKMDKMVEVVPSEEDVMLALDDAVMVEDEVETVFCTACEDIAAHTCHRCEVALCETHNYHEENGTLRYCRACADAIVGVCDVCDALHARACRECGTKVCETDWRRVIERWGWGAPGQGGFMSWFPIMRTYCQRHGSYRIDLPKPKLRAFTPFQARNECVRLLAILNFTILTIADCGLRIAKLAEISSYIAPRLRGEKSAIRIPKFYNCNSFLANIQHALILSLEGSKGYDGSSPEW